MVVETKEESIYDHYREEMKLDDMKNSPIWRYLVKVFILPLQESDCEDIYSALHLHKHGLSTSASQPQKALLS